MNVIKEAVLSLKKYKFTVVTTIFILAFNLFVLGIFAMLMYNLNNFLNEIRDSVEISVYLKEGTKKEAADAIAMEIKLRTGIDDAVFVSRDEAIKEFAQNEDFKTYLDSFKINPLPDSIRVVIKKEFKKDPVKLKEFADSFKAIENVTDVYYQKEEFERFFSLAGIIRKIVIWLSVILIAGSVFIVSSTVRISVFARKDDIKKMKSSGVTLFGIKSIFIIESMIEGAAGGILAVLLLAGVERIALEKLNILWSGKWLPVNPVIVMIVIASGIILGLISSLLFRIKPYTEK
ncbi:MAG: permease-like cell division protein FtsX [Candidatus Firestonebacteria bacterium]